MTLTGIDVKSLSRYVYFLILYEICNFFEKSMKGILVVTLDKEIVFEILSLLIQSLYDCRNTDFYNSLRWIRNKFRCNVFKNFFYPQLYQDVSKFIKKSY